MRDPLNSPPVLTRPFITLALVMIGLTGCSSGGGVSSSVVAVADNYYINNPGDTITIGAPGVLQNDSGSELTAELVGYSGPPGTLTLNANGSFTYTHNITATSFNYRAVNGSGRSMASVAISINQPPVVNNTCTSTPAGISIGNGVLTATDPENQSLTYALVTGGAKGSVNVFSNGSYTYTPKTNLPIGDGRARGMDQFTFSATDSMGLSATGTVTVFIDGNLRIMPLGDSITEGVFGDSNLPTTGFRIGYRKKLYDDLIAASYPVNFVGSLTEGGSAGLADPDHEGHPGFLDDQVAASITAWLNTTQPDFLLLHIGTNGINAGGGTSATDVQNILNAVDAWEALNSSPITVFLARIIGSPDGTTNSNINTFNNNVVNMAAARTNDKIVIVNQQTGAGINYSLSTDMADNLHPNQGGYDKMADKWKSDLLGSTAFPTCQ